MRILFCTVLECNAACPRISSHFEGCGRCSNKDNELKKEVIKNAKLLANHGCVSVGKTLEDACKLVEAAEEVLKIYHLAQSIGEVSNMAGDLPELCMRTIHVALAE